MAEKRDVKRNWTIMVYLAGDNNLDSAGAVDLNEMKSVGTTDQVAVLAQFDRAGANVATTRYCLRKGTAINSDAVQSLGETNMGDPKVLEDFISWGVTSYPAEHYLLVLWNHGAGWDDANLYQGDVFSGAAPPVSRKKQMITRGATADVRPVPMSQARAGLARTHKALFSTTVAAAITDRAIAFDDQAQDFLDNIELKKVLTSASKKLNRKIDIVGMDACLMSMAEVAFQMRDVADYSVGSEETEPGDGWPYDRILTALAATPTMTPEQLSKTIVTEYLASYKDNDNVTQAATKLAGLTPLATAIDGLGKALREVLPVASSRAAIISARAQVQEYSRPYDDYCDVLDLCSLIDLNISDQTVRAACASVKQAAAAAIVASGGKGPGVDKSTGLSIYFPKRKISPLYDTLDFTKECSWDEFLKAYLSAIGR